MVPSAKGKEKIVDNGKGSKAAGKRKRVIPGDDDKSGDKKRKNRGVLQFFEDSSYEVGADEESDDDSFLNDDSLEDEFGADFKAPNEAPKANASYPPVVPKEEQMTEEELEKMLEERYKPGSSFVTYAEDNFETKRFVDTSTSFPSEKDPAIWKVKCMVGRERHSAFCLMQKYVDLLYLGKKLQIISAFAIDHVKGFIYIEAEKQCDIYEACNGLCSIYQSRVAPVPKDETYHLFSVRSKGSGISEGMWARVKSGTYKGDLAQVAAVNDARKKVTVKLIPRIDLQAMAEKFGRGITPIKTVTPTPRIISSRELEEFRPLIQYRRDRDTNKIFEILDGMMLKDGYLYKKVSVDSLSFGGVTPTEDELLKFAPSKNEELNDAEWLSQLYGERKKKRPIISEKGCGKGEGSSASSMDNKFEVHDLVFFSKKDFGVIIGSEKDDTFKIIKEGSEGPITVNIQLRELKNAAFDRKLFTALDQNMKNISVGDTVGVLDGPLKNRKGMVKKIYRGIVFLYDETQEENNGYICIKAKLCGKVEPPAGVLNEEGGDPEPSSAFGGFCSSPKSPLSPEKSLQQIEGSGKFDRDDNAMFHVGQALRIRVGPLKGYLCRVLAVRRSEVTVKLDSQHKILTVKCEDLAEVRGKSSVFSAGVDTGSSKPFGLLGVQDDSKGWMDGAGTATDGGGGWNSGGVAAERSSWPAFPTSSISQDPTSMGLPISTGEDTKKDSSWETKVTQDQGSWAAAVAAQVPVNGWGRAAATAAGFGDSTSDGWGKAVESHHITTTEGVNHDSWGQPARTLSSNDNGPGNGSVWNSCGAVQEKKTGEWGNRGDNLNESEESAWAKASTANKVQTVSWGGVKKDGETTGGWGARASGLDQPVEDQDKGSFEGNKDESWSKRDTCSSWNKKAGGNHFGSSWNREDGETSWGKQDGGSPWSKSEGGTSSWSKPDGGKSSWSKQNENADAEPKVVANHDSWERKIDFGSDKGTGSWKAGSENKDDTDQHQTWGRSQAYDSGRGSGGRRGRGRARGESGRGRSFGRGGSSNWTKDDQENQDSKDRITAKGSSWSRDQGGCWGGKQDDSWRGKSSGGGWNDKSLDGGSPAWGSDTPKASDGGWNNSGWNNSGWNKKSSDSGGGWNDKKSSDGGSSAWGSKSGSDTPKASDGGWNNSGRDQKSSDAGGGWNDNKSSDGGSSAWGSKSSSDTPKVSGGGWNNSGQDQKFPDSCGGGWNGKKSLDGGSSVWGSKSCSDAPTASGGGWKKSSDGGGGGWNDKKSLDEGSSAWGSKNCSDTSGGWNNSGRDQKSSDSGGGWIDKKSSDGDSSAWGSKSGSDTPKALDEGWNKSGRDQMFSDSDADGWNSKKPLDGGSSWGSKSGSDAPKASGGGWNNLIDKKSADSGGWNGEKSSDGGSSVWGVASGSDAPKASGGGWNNSGWDKKSALNSTDKGQDIGNSWNNKKSADGSSSSGWGQSKWSGTSTGDGNPDPWGSKSNWNSENISGSEQADSYSDRGRGGSWRGGRGGRWGSEGGRFGNRGGPDRGGFVGRSRSGRGGFGCRGGSDRGGIGGRGGSDRGGFGGRGGLNGGNYEGRGGDRGGYHGRGGFGGRGRGRRDEWKNTNESEDKPLSWNNPANRDASWSVDNAKGWTGNTSGGSWKSGSSDKNQWQGATSEGNERNREGEGNMQATGWNKELISSKDGGSDTISSGWTSQENSWKPSGSSAGPTSSAWNQPSADRNEGEGAGAGAVDAWGKAAASSWSLPKEGGGKGGW